MIRVLLVDDESTFVEIARQLLEKNREFEVVAMSSAEEALTSQDLLSYDAIVSDYQMSNMDGLTFLRAVRKKSLDIPFILFTGRGREEVVIQALDEGVDFYVQKGGDPIAQFSELAHKIKRAIERRRLRARIKEDVATNEIDCQQAENILPTPSVKVVHLAKREKSIIRCCFVQIAYSLKKDTKIFGYYPEDPHYLKMKIISSIQIAKENNVDLLCFPELCFKKEWIEEFCKLSGNLIIVGGTFYHDGYNVCSLIFNGKLVQPPYKKIHPSVLEQEDSPGNGMRSGNSLYVYETHCGVLSILTCIDYPVFSRYILMKVRKPIEIFINPCFDEKIKRFHDLCNVDCKNNNISVIRINCSRNSEGDFGDSCLFSKEHKSIIKDLEAGGHRDSSDEKYLLLKTKQEEMVIFDINIDILPSVDLPLSYKRRVKIIKKYQFNIFNRIWEEQQLYAPKKEPSINSSEGSTFNKSKPWPFNTP